MFGSSINIDYYNYVKHTDPICKRCTESIYLFADLTQNPLYQEGNLNACKRQWEWRKVKIKTNSRFEIGLKLFACMNSFKVEFMREP